MKVHEEQRFHNRTLELDGHVYRRCHLINCQLRFRGHAAFILDGNRYEGALWVDLIDDWRSMPEALDPLRAELRRYGADLDEALNPPKQRWGDEWGWAPALIQGQPEMHIQYWFQRDGKPPGGLTLVAPEGGNAE